jgi:PAS domain S-box-containing protein
VTYITKTEEAEAQRDASLEALRTSEATNRSLLDALPDSIFRINRQGILVDAKLADSFMPLVPPNEFLGKSVFDVLPSKLAQQTMDCVARTLQTGEMQTLDYQLPQGDALRDYEARIIRCDRDQVLAIIREITTRKHAQAAAQESERRFRSLFDNAPLCMFEVDLNHSPPAILAANRRAEQVYGWSTAELSLVTIEIIFLPEAVTRLRHTLAQARAGHIKTIETGSLRRDGSSFPARVSATASAESEGQHIILTVEDITSEKQRRSELEAIDQDRQRIAHEIHDALAQNLAAMRMKASLWHDLIDTNPSQMHAESDYLLEILKTSIQDARRSVFALRPIALNELGIFPALRQFMADLGQQYQVRTELHVSGPEERLPCSLELPLFRIIQEALNNVGKHAQASTVWVSLDLEQTEKIRLTIRDDGIGFDPSAPKQGDHFGLRHMRERVESVHGSLLVESQPGHGTNVLLTLPLNEA